MAALVNLIEEKDSASAHGFDHRTVEPNGLAVVETEPTEQVILISIGSDIDAEKLALGFRANLLDHQGLTVSGKPRNEGRIEHPRGDNLFHILEVAERNVVRHLTRNRRVGHARGFR